MIEKLLDDLKKIVFEYLSFRELVTLQRLSKGMQSSVTNSPVFQAFKLCAILRDIIKNEKGASKLTEELNNIFLKYVSEQFNMHHEVFFAAEVFEEIVLQKILENINKDQDKYQTLQSEERWNVYYPALKNKKILKESSWFFVINKKELELNKIAFELCFSFVLNIEGLVVSNENIKKMNTFIGDCLVASSAVKSYTLSPQGKFLYLPVEDFFTFLLTHQKTETNANNKLSRKAIKAYIPGGKDLFTVENKYHFQFSNIMSFFQCSLPFNDDLAQKLPQIKVIFKERIINMMQGEINELAQKCEFKLCDSDLKPQNVVGVYLYLYVWSKRDEFKGLLPEKQWSAVGGLIAKASYAKNLVSRWELRQKENSHSEHMDLCIMYRPDIEHYELKQANLVAEAICELLKNFFTNVCRTDATTGKIFRPKGPKGPECPEDTENTEYLIRIDLHLFCMKLFNIYDGIGSDSSDCSNANESLFRQGKHS